MKNFSNHERMRIGCFRRRKTSDLFRDSYKEVMRSAGDAVEKLDCKESDFFEQ
jgi:hypothetical protein